MLVRESAYLFWKKIEHVKILDLIFCLLFMSQKYSSFFLNLHLTHKLIKPLINAGGELALLRLHNLRNLYLFYILYFLLYHFPLKICSIAFVAFMF